MRTALRVRRWETGLSQEELADELGVSRQTVSSVENGQSVPSVLLALKIAAVLDAPVEELFPVVPLPPLGPERFDPERFWVGGGA